MRQLRLSLVALILLCLPWQVAANELAATLTKSDFSVAFCNVAQMSVQLDLRLAYGADEPMLAAAMRWEAGPRTDSKCLAANTTLYARLVPADGTITRGEDVYVKLRPDIGPSGTEFGPNITLSPNWHELFCREPNDISECLSSTDARKLLAAQPAVADFVVEGESKRPTLATPVTGPRAAANPTGADLAGLIESSVASLLSPEQRAAFAAERRTEWLLSVAPTAEVAAQNIVSTIGAGLASYATPPRACESSRKVSHWAQSSARCVIEFRSEQSHRFTCTNNGKALEVVVPQTARVDFTQDVAAVEQPRISIDGWTAVALRLYEPKAQIGSGRDSYTAARFQITAAMDRVSEIETLNANLQALAHHCGTATDAQ